MKQQEFNFSQPVKATELGSLESLVDMGLKNAGLIEASLPELPTAFPIIDKNGTRHVVHSAKLLEGVRVGRRRLKFTTILEAQCFYDHLQTVSTSTAILYTQQLSGKGSLAQSLRAMSGLTPAEARSLWTAKIFPEITSYAHGSACRSVLHFYARRCLGQWQVADKELIRNLPNVSFDPYKTVRSNDAFVSPDDNARIIEFLNESAERAAFLPPADLIGAALLSLHWQQGLRPIQTAGIKVSDCKIEGTDHCRIRFRWAKQRGETVRETVRRMKSEWVPIFERLRSHAEVEAGLEGPLFCLSSATEIGKQLDKILNRVCVGHWTAMNLRHSAAQRHADAGRSQEEIATFLCHSDPSTCLVYIENAATEAERVNKALGLSKVYTNIHKIAHSRTIDKDKLLSRPDDHQIGAIVHGLPIAGIGACDVGQSICTLNPVLSCYGCPKFLPVNDHLIHRSVAASLRPIVNDFLDAGRGNRSNPTFSQLRSTIETAEEISRSFEKGDGA